MVETGRPKIGQRSLQALREEIARKHGKTPEQLYEEREITCVMAHPPQSLRLARVQESEEYHRGLVDKCGKGGGFVLWMVLPSKGNPAEIKAMVESVRRYAEY